MMENTMFAKMKIKPGMAARVVNQPEDYPAHNEVTWKEEGEVDFVQFFVEQQAEFALVFDTAISSLKEEGLLWMCYPKSSGKTKYDINRDSLWDLVLPVGYHPVSQVALDEKWSAIRLKKNELGVAYARPNAK